MIFFTDLTSTKEQNERTSLFCKEIYTSNCPLSLFETAECKLFFHRLRPAYQLPTRKTISNNELEKIYNITKDNIESVIKQSENLTLSTDGWTNIRNEGIINFMIHSENFEYFYDYVLPKEKRHTAQYISDEISKIIDKIGPSKVVGLVTDNASNMTSAWNTLKIKYPKLLSYGCIAHILNLLFKDIEKIPSFKNHINNVKDVVKFFKMKHIPAAMLRAKSNISLKLPVETRWASSIECIKSLQTNKTPLQQIVITDEVSCLVSTSVRKNILSSKFWEENQRFYSLCSILSDTIKFMESSQARLSDVRHKFMQIKNKFKHDLVETQFSQKEKNDILIAIDNRMAMALSDAHNAAYLLDPRYLGKDLSTAELESALDLIIIIYDDPKIKRSIIGEVTNFRAKSNNFSKKLIWDSAMCITSVCEKPSDITPIN